MTFILAAVGAGCLLAGFLTGWVLHAVDTALAAYEPPADPHDLDDEGCLA